MTADLSLADIRCNFVQTTDDMFALKRWMGERRPILGIDTETGGFDWWRQELRMVQVGDALTGWSIPFQDWRGLCKEIIGGYTEPIVFHNFKFDCLYLEHNGVHVPRANLHDSEVLVHLDNSSMPKSLKASATRMISNGFAGGQVALDQAFAEGGWSWDTIPLEHPAYWSYAALDPVMTARIYEKLKHHTAQPIYDVEIAATQVLERMERRGVRIDLEYTQEMRIKLRGYAAQLRAWAREQFGIKNLTSDAQVRDFLLAAGWQPTVFTDGGKPSVKKSVLQWVEHPVADAKVACAHAEKLAGSYLDNFMAYADGERLHAKIHAIGARTGRMSISEPALQQLPADDATIRDCFIPGDGNRLVICDYDQVEMRLLAHFSDSQPMRDVFASGNDIFTWMASEIYGDPTMTKKDPRRGVTKNAAYAKGYGAGADKFADTAGIDVATASQFYARYDAVFPELPRYADQLQREANQRKRDEGVAYVSTAYGRREVLGRGDGTYKLLNYKVQGTAADVLKIKLVEMDAAGLGEYLVLPVHDEFDLDVPAELVPEVERIIQEVMPLYDFSVPVTVGVDVVDRWGDKYRKEAAA